MSGLDFSWIKFGVMLFVQEGYTNYSKKSYSKFSARTENP